MSTSRDSKRRRTTRMNRSGSSARSASNKRSKCTALIEDVNVLWKQIEKERRVLESMQNRERSFLKSRNKSLDSELDSMQTEIEKTANVLLRTFYKLFEAISDTDELDVTFVE